jgi:hypothetical protein
MNKKVFSSLKSKKKLLEEKIEKNNLKIKEYQQQNIDLLKELEECNKNVSTEVMEILKITPFEFLEKFFSGEKVEDILSITEKESDTVLENQEVDKDYEMLEVENEEN